MTLISAPAGFGKTTVITEWINACDRKFAWLSLDERDSDLSRFLLYFVHAMQTVVPSFGEKTVAMLEGTQPFSTESILTTLLNEVTAIPHEIALVLDDYHVLDSPQIDEVLTFFLDHLPQQMNLVIATRQEPALPLARLRARGLLSELRSTDLRFTAEEISVFLNDLMVLNLDPEELIDLEKRTEGWAASLQLIALSLKQRAETKRSQFIQQFTTSNQYLMDYLIDEVLSQQSTQGRQFLRFTAILRRFNASLCRAVVGNNNPTRLIDLDRANLFLISLDETHVWFRYHHLFAELLQHQLRQTEAGLLPQLHLRAANWFAEAGYLDDAIYHALQASDYDRATTFLSEHIENMVIRGDFRSALYYINQLPPTHRNIDQRICLYHAWALLFIGQFNQCAQTIENLTALPNLLGWPVTAYETLIKGYLAIRNDRFPNSLHQGIPLLQQAFDQLAQLPEPDKTNLMMQGAAAVELAFNYPFENEIRKSAAMAQSAVDLNVKAGNSLAALAAWSKLGEFVCAQGEWHRAADILNQGLNQVRVWSGEFHWSNSKLLAAAPLILNKGLIHYQWNELDKATQLIEEAEALYAQLNGLNRPEGMLGLAWLRWSQGNEAAIAEILKTLQELSQASPFVFVQQRLEAAVVEWQIRLMLMGDKWNYLQTEIQTWVERCGLQRDDPLNSYNEPGYVALVRAWCFMGQVEAALILIQRLQTFATESGRTGDVWRYRVIEIVAQKKLGKTDTARHILQETMHATEPESLIRLYVDEGQPLASLLQQLPTAPYRDRLLAALNRPSIESSQLEPKSPNLRSELIEPLSSRELEVLQLLTAGATNQQIADKLFIAHTTAKKHVSNIMGKLGVGNRVSAVAHARDLGLIK
ncbi:MAG: LuxR C-terminal-related transcriptional regulator [Anaerolineae bacterium]